jgi:hypothetical protein
MSKRNVTNTMETMTTDGPDSTYTNQWFDGDTPSNARQKLIRWTEGTSTTGLAFCGAMYGHFFNYKVSRCIHETRRDGTMNFHEKFKKDGYYVLKHVFRSHILKIIHEELLNAEEVSWVYPDVSLGQVKTHLLKTRLENPSKHGGCVFLHHFLKTVVAGTFPEKVLWEAALQRTHIPPGQKKWRPCKFHVDLTYAKPEMLNNAKSPISLYFPVEDLGNQPLTIDLVPKNKIKGPQPKARTLKLQSGDILLFDTGNTSHRTSIPLSRTTQDRLNMVMTGFQEYIDYSLEDEDENWASD